MRYTFIIHHEKYPTSLGCRWYVHAESQEDANEAADRICKKLQHGKKPNKKQGALIHTNVELIDD